ncbi:MAG: 8-amino-7-oxononanoate synthase [Alphaproteobacteria bacterium]|nr:8-amino-7-oxononanoate synthase [Alphaproteobacteria bacterium]
MDKIESLYADFLHSRKTQGLKRDLVDISRFSPPQINIDGHPYINFSSNDYLGLNSHPALIERAQEWAERYGAGSGASRLVTGNLEIFTKIEDKIAAFKNKEAALVMVSGFQTNASLLPALFDKEALGETPLVFSDKLNHASMHLGCHAAGITQIRYRHNDMAHLKELLEKHSNNAAPKFILTESVFSMDGDIAPLEKIYSLAQQHQCFTIVDEAHATGVLGQNGQGLATKADLVIGTFSKAFGSFGAYVACSKVLKDYLVNKCSGVIYATALPPSVLGSIDAALDLIPDMNKERDYLQNIATYFRQETSNLGFDCGKSKTQIVPLMIGSANHALDLSQILKQNGLWATAIRPPTVPPNTARIRFAFSASHTDQDLEKLLNILKTIPQEKAA